MLTDGDTGQAGVQAALTVSVNFWFAPYARLTRPTALPLSPMLEVELMRQLEMLVADALDDRGELVPPFLRALVQQLERTLPPATDPAAGAADSGALDGGATTAPFRLRVGGGQWRVLHRGRPADVSMARWEALFEEVVGKLSLWLPAPADLLPFLRRHACWGRFAGLRLQ